MKDGQEWSSPAPFFLSEWCFFFNAASNMKKCQVMHIFLICYCIVWIFIWYTLTEWLSVKVQYWRGSQVVFSEIMENGKCCECWRIIFVAGKVDGAVWIDIDNGRHCKTAYEMELLDDDSKCCTYESERSVL
jgi:hypothetical protein